jgi:threonine aldolase
MIVLDLEHDRIPPAACVDYGKRAGVSLFPSGRLVFHHQISVDAAAKLVNALTRLMEDKNAGVALETRKVTGGYI